MLHPLLILTFITLIAFSNHLRAIPTNKSACDIPSQQCLLWVNKKLNSAVTPYSMQWYNLKLLQMDSLSTIKEFKLLKNELSVLQTHNNLPPLFATYLNVYQAKLLLIDGNKQQAKSLLTSAVKDLVNLNQSFYSPMRLISIANLMQNLQQNEQSLALLQQVENDYIDSRDLHLKLELYGNLGHIHRILNNHEISLNYYKRSLHYAIQLGVEQQIATLHNHVGRMYQATGKLRLAELSYINALKHSEKDARLATIVNAKINLAYFYVQQLKLDKAKNLIQNIQKSDVEPHQVKQWQSILDAI